MQKQYAYFSAAIRDGAKLRPQAFDSGMGQFEQESCAHRAGREAVAGYHEATSVVIQQLFPYMNLVVICPDLGCEARHEAEFMLVHLNDDHRWTREQIADWLYVEEEKLGFVTIDTEALKQPEAGRGELAREPREVLSA